MMPSQAVETPTTSRNFKVEIAEGIATLLLDVPGEKVNVLSPEVGEKLRFDGWKNENGQGWESPKLLKTP